MIHKERDYRRMTRIPSYLGKVSNDCNLSFALLKREKFDYRRCLNKYFNIP